MKVTIGGKVYDWDPDALDFEEAEYLETALNMTVPEWMNGLLEGRSKARRGLVWYLERKHGDDPAVKLHDLAGRPYVELEIDWDAGEPEDPTEAAAPAIPGSPPED